MKRIGQWARGKFGRRAALGRRLGDIIEAQKTALALIETLEERGQPVEPALRFIIATGYDEARRLREEVKG